MARRLFLHVGPAKTGTTYLQSAWFQHRPDLEAGGVLYPGAEQLDQFRACAIVIDKRVSTQRMAPRYAGTWDRLTAEVRDWDGDAIVSSEHYAGGGPAAAERVHATLTDIADEVHLVVTARDLARQVPAAWQQSVKHGSSETFDSFWRRLAASSTTGFWRGQDLPSMMERWGAGLPADRIHLVVHGRPGSDRDLLWTRMCQVTGVDPGILRPVPRTNESIGAVNAELLRRANSHRPAEIDRRDLGGFTKSTFTKDVLARVGTPATISLPPEGQAWAVERGRTMADALATRGYDVVGDLADLIPDAEPAPGRTPESVTDSELAEAAAPVIALLLARELEAPRRRRRARPVSEKPDDRTFGQRLRNRLRGVVRG
jgi:hypothetical protein